MPTFAAVDIGANSVRLKIARLLRHKLHVVHEDREVTRLGASVFQTGVLSPESMAQAISVLQRFHRATQEYGAEQVRVIGTSSLRDARNARTLMDWVRSATGWTIEVVSGAEEGRLIHLGILAFERAPQNRMLLVDLGGGSCEFTLSVNGHIRQLFSLPLGAVRLTGEFLKNDPPTLKELERLRRYIEEELRPVAKALRRERIQGTIATSGTAAALMTAARNVSERSTALTTVTAAMAARIAEEMGQQSKADRATQFGIGARRSEIIVAGATVFAEFLRAISLRGFRYSTLGLRDGVLAAMAAESDIATTSHEQVESDRADALVHVAERYQVDHAHAANVRRTAEQLFDALRPLHQLPSTYRHRLSAAATIHEVGGFLNRAGRHRHTYYIIQHSELLGFSPAERRLIATLARFVGKSKPDESDRLIKLLAPAERAPALRAIALLRLAVTLNQSRRGVVKAVAMRQKRSRVELRITRKGNTDLELWSSQKEADYFRRVFGLSLDFTLD